MGECQNLFGPYREERNRLLRYKRPECSVVQSVVFSLDFSEFRLIEKVGEEKCAYAIFAGGSEGREATSTTFAQMVNINIDFQIIWCRGMDEVCLFRIRNQTGCCALGSEISGIKKCRLF
jgi:hypothetical protein